MLSNVGQNNVFGVVAISKKHGALPLEISWASHSDTALHHAPAAVSWQLNCLRPVRALEAVQRLVQKSVACRLGTRSPGTCSSLGRRRRFLSIVRACSGGWPRATPALRCSRKTASALIGTAD